MYMIAYGHLKPVQVLAFDHVFDKNFDFSFSIDNKENWLVHSSSELVGNKRSKNTTIHVII